MFLKPTKTKETECNLRGVLNFIFICPSQKPRNPSKSPIWVTGTQPLGPLPAAFQTKLESGAGART